MTGPLAGIRVLDVTTVIMGPYATSILADLGADVIKVEPRGGDVGRALGPSRHDGMSAVTLNLHRNKRSTVLDLTGPDDRAEFDRIVAGADAVVTNLRPAARDKLGLDPEVLLAAHPSLVVCTAQAFGSGSAQRDAPAYDDVVQAASGMCDTYRRVDGEPRYAPSIIADKVCGMAIVNALLAALLHRAGSGQGQWVDVPMVDTMAAFTLVEHLAGRTFVPPLGDVGWSRTLEPRRRPHAARDGWLCVMPYSDRDWLALFTHVGREDVLRDPRFATATLRHRNSGPLQEILAEIVSTRDVAYWLECCAELGIAAQEVVDLAELGRSGYLAERGLLTEREHPTEGRYLSIRHPADYSRTPVTAYEPAPLPGADPHPSWRPRPVGG